MVPGLIFVSLLLLFPSSIVWWCVSFPPLGPKVRTTLKTKKAWSGPRPPLLDRLRALSHLPGLVCTNGPKFGPAKRGPLFLYYKDIHMANSSLVLGLCFCSGQELGLVLCSFIFSNRWNWKGRHAPIDKPIKSRVKGNTAHIQVWVITAWRRYVTL